MAHTNVVSLLELLDPLLIISKAGWLIGIWRAKSANAFRMNTMFAGLVCVKRLCEVGHASKGCVLRSHAAEMMSLSCSMTRRIGHGAKLVQLAHREKSVLSHADKAGLMSMLCHVCECKRVIL
jgi:hypothetical protein